MENNVTANSDVFVTNRIRSEPVEYTVTISHYVANGKMVMGLGISGVAPSDEEQRNRIASDLRRAAILFETCEFAESEK